jgi:hypothetical protein
MLGKGKTMRKIARYAFAPLLLGAAIFAAAAPAANAAVAGPAHAYPAACPAGSHWDNITHSCIPD